MMRAKQVNAYRSGLFAETLVALMLRLKGYAIIAQRYKTPVGEINLVVSRATTLPSTWC